MPKEAHGSFDAGQTDRTTSSGSSTPRPDIYEQALEEVTRGRKQSHWMWFVFPQIAGLGRE